MHLKMCNTVCIHRLHLRFCNIMEQHRKSQDLISSDLFDRLQRVHSYWIHMMRRLLTCPHHLIKFRKNHFCNSKFIWKRQQTRIRRYEHLDQFHLNPHCTDICKCRRKLSNPFHRLVFNPKSKLCRKSHCAQNPKRIFPKTLPRIAHTTDHLSLQIFDSAENIHQTFFFIICHRIDRKVSS